MHASEEFIVVKNSLPEKVPIFNRGVYLENKQKVGIIDDVFGPINEFMFSVKCESGIKPNSFKPGQKVILSYKIFSFIWIQCVFYLFKDFYLNLKVKRHLELEEEAEEVEEDSEVDEEEKEVEEEDSEEEKEVEEEDSEEMIEVEEEDSEEEAIRE